MIVAIAYCLFILTWLVGEAVLTANTTLPEQGCSVAEYMKKATLATTVIHWLLSIPVVYILTRVKQYDNTSSYWAAASKCEKFSVILFVFILLVPFAFQVAFSIVGLTVCFQDWKHLVLPWWSVGYVIFSVLVTGFMYVSDCMNGNLSSSHSLPLR